MSGLIEYFARRDPRQVQYLIQMKPTTEALFSKKNKKYQKLERYQHHRASIKILKNIEIRNDCSALSKEDCVYVYVCVCGCVYGSEK
jgi:hypothetical protein